jgi:hypothetical protein
MAPLLALATNFVRARRPADAIVPLRDAAPQPSNATERRHSAPRSIQKFNSPAHLDLGMHGDESARPEFSADLESDEAEIVLDNVPGRGMPMMSTGVAFAMPSSGPRRQSHI